MALILYTHPMSPCAQKVRIVLAEKGLEWQARHVDLPGKANLDPDYLKLNPLGVVPTLVEDGRAVIESSIICEYLDDRFPEPSLRPADAWQIARMRFWMKHIDVKVHPSCGALQWPLVMADKLKALSVDEQEAMINKVVEKPRRERQRRLLRLGYDAPDIEDAVRVYQATIVDMDETFADQSWLAGDSFSLADAAMAPYFQTLTQFGWQSWYKLKPRVADWYRRCTERPSYQRGVAADLSSEDLADLDRRGEPAWDKIKIILGGLGVAA